MIRAKTQRLVGNRVLVLGFVLAALMAASLMLTAKPAHAANFTVSNTNDSGAGSLRQAITDTNNTPGANIIRFNIPGSGVKTIKPASELPEITEAVTIDGYSQSGATKNTTPQGPINANPKIELDGTNAGSANGLAIRADNVVVRGLVINRFNDAGIDVRDSANDPEPTGVKIEGNFIGTDAAGQGDLGNQFEGVLLSAGKNNTIGGATPEARNLISGNDNDGIELGSGARSNKVEGNLIGTKKDGTSDLGNTDDGMDIFDSDNTIGGAAPGAANTIAFNDSKGVRVTGVDSINNRILGNSIFSNGKLGIDLDGGNEDANGHNANDPGDGDTGPNNLQNFPVLTSAVSTEGNPATIKGTLDSAPSSLIAGKKKKKKKKKSIFLPQTFTLQFFSSPQNEDEGRTFLGETQVVTDLTGKASFSFQTSQQVRAGENITATTTDASGNTSEFSAPVGFSTD